MDTVALARHEREKNGNDLRCAPCQRCATRIITNRASPGPWKVEVSYGGEADLRRHLDSCDKNPGHLKFVPVDQFNIDHLPPDYHDNDLVDLVLATSDLTVRVSVTYVSEKRPETFPGSDIPYPCYKNRSSDMMRVGTGSVRAVNKYVQMHGKKKKTCVCKNCLNSPTPKTQFVKILILTATHVVYDNLEGTHTTCHLFFDKGGTPDVCNSVVTLSGMLDVESNIDSDICVMTFATHDLALADKVDNMLRHREQLITSVGTRYNSPMFNNQQHKHVPDPCHPLTIIVSHPHGCSKQVSVGYRTEVYQSEIGLTQYLYTTATCPGSSGASVYVLGWVWYGWGYAPIHSGNCLGNKEVNYSGYGRDTQG